MKIQYPGVARSIESDVDNLLRIISVANVLPKGMYIENAAKVLLTWPWLLSPDNGSDGRTRLESSLRL